MLRAWSIPASRRAEPGSLVISVAADERLSASGAWFRRLAALPQRILLAFPMMRFVRGLGKDLKILGSVVRAFSVDVVYNFAWQQWPAQHCRGDQAMLKDVAVFHRVGMFRLQNHPVSVRQHDGATDPSIVVCPASSMATKIPERFPALDAPQGASARRELRPASTSAQHTRIVSAFKTQETQ